VSISGLVVVSAIFPLAAFYFMDRLWYDRPLDGSVYAGIEAETALKDLGYKVDLGSKIKEHSPFKLWLTKKTMIRSATKMDLFYAILAGSLLLVAGFLGFGIQPQAVVDKTPPPIVAPPAANLPPTLHHPRSPPIRRRPHCQYPSRPLRPGRPRGRTIVGNSQASK
jgi:hypothetical protein